MGAPRLQKYAHELTNNRITRCERRLCDCLLGSPAAIDYSRCRDHRHLPCSDVAKRAGIDCFGLAQRLDVEALVTIGNVKRPLR